MEGREDEEGTGGITDAFSGQLPETEST